MTPGSEWQPPTGRSIHWKSGRFKTNEYVHARPDAAHQRINHYPKTSPICVKDQLVRLLRRLRTTYGRAGELEVPGSSPGDVT